MSASANLLDVNCWLALTYEGHSCHRAMKRIESGLRQDGLVFCRLTQMGLLRLFTTASAMGGTAMTMQEAWQSYDALLAEPNVSYRDEPGGIERPVPPLRGARDGISQSLVRRLSRGLRVHGGFTFGNFRLGLGASIGMSIVQGRRSSETPMTAPPNSPRSSATAISTGSRGCGSTFRGASPTARAVSISRPRAGRARSSATTAITRPATTCGSWTGTSSRASQRPYLKQFHHEEELHVALLVDASHSMLFEGKLALAHRLAAALGVLGLRGEREGERACARRRGALGSGRARGGQGKLFAFLRKPRARRRRRRSSGASRAFCASIADAASRSSSAIS